MPGERLRYTVSMRNPNTHYFEVSLRISGVATERLRLFMPVWTPGSYMVREFERNVVGMEAEDASTGGRLSVEKDSKNAWSISSGGSGDIVARYKVYAFDFGVQTSYLDEERAIVNGASVFVCVEGMEHEAIRLTLIPYQGWKETSTSLETIPAESSGAIDLSAPNYDVLVDSPIEVGNQSLHSFRVRGVQHQVSIHSARKFDEVAFVSDIEKIVGETIPIFDHVPYKRYVFLVDLSDEKSGGLEHLGSTFCIAPYFRLEPPQEYHILLSLFSHEFFHAWNVKRLRPKALGPFDYSSENYTKSLWIAEGVTSYYDDLILRRADLYTVAEYLDAFCANVNPMKSLPGGRWQSAEEASFDTWISQYRPSENSPNVDSSYYTQGAVIGWMIDLQVRMATECSRSLDDVMRKMYAEKYLGENAGYTEEEFEAACNETAGRSLSQEIFDARVRGRTDVDFERYLGYAGLSLSPKKTQDEVGYLGVRVSTDSGRLVVANRLSGSPAESAGLSAGDEIIGVDGLRVDSPKLQFYVSNRKPGTRVRLLISRDGGLRDLEAVLSQKPTFEYRINKKEEASAEEKRLFRSWLRAEWDDEIRYVEYKQAPSRRNPLDYF